MRYTENVKDVKMRSPKRSAIIMSHDCHFLCIPIMFPYVDSADIVSIGYGN